MVGVEVVVQETWYSVEECRDNPRTLYVFGDNVVKYGCAGQAVIRYEPNSIGIPTKSRPSMDESSFFSDTPMQGLKIEESIVDILVALMGGKFDKVVFPADGLGTGLADMPGRSPILYRKLNERLLHCFGVKFDGFSY